MKLSKLICEMQAKKQDMITRIKDIDQCISFLQSHCDHQYTWIANTHNDDIHECVHCMHRMKI